MNLPRLSAKHPEKLDKKKFTVDALKVPAGATGTRKLSQRGIDYLDLDPNKTWARSLRGSPKDVVFISFCVNASIGTEFELAGALLRVAASKEAGKVQVQARVPDAKKPGAFVWKSVGIRTAIDTFNGRSLAPLPVFTARLDPAAGAWDLFLGSRQLAAGMKITDETKSNARKFRLRAGGAGAQLCALVISDDNPLFTDTNANGVEDGFEQNSNGALLSKHSTEAEKKNVASAWRAAQKGRNGGNIGAKRPAPDRVALTARTK